jgi:microcystin-dependent protein
MERVVPIGTIVMWSGELGDLPPNWKLCDGSSYDRSDNGESITTPNLSGRFIAAFDAGDTDYSIGFTGGEDSVTLSVEEIPEHDHFLTPAERSYKLFGGDSGELMDHGDNGGNIYQNPIHTYDKTGITGGGEAHENRPRYYTLAFIMRI